MKKKDEIKDLREASSEVLEEKVRSSKEELMHLRFKQASGQLENNAQVKELRRSIARAMTVLSEREGETAQVEG